MDIIFLTIAALSLLSCIYALDIVKRGREPRNGEEEEIKRIEKKINDHYVRKS